MLGRYGEPGGHYRGELRIDIDSEPLLAHTTVLDGNDQEFNGPGDSGGARVMGTLVLAGAAAETTAARMSSSDRDDILRGTRTRSAGACGKSIARPGLRVHDASLPAVGEAEGLRWALTPMEGPGVLLIVLGARAPLVSGILDRFEVAFQRDIPSPRRPARRS